jgi:GT2 family glycosyltransferase
LSTGTALSLASPTDGSSPLICLYGVAATPAADAALRARLPSQLECMDLAEVGRGAALRAVAARAQGRDVILIARDALLPPHWWPRLQAAMEGAPDIGVLSALDAGLEGFEAMAHDDDAAMRIDAACWAMSERRQIPSNDASRLLGAWRSAAVAAARDAGADEALPFGTQAARLDHLFVGATQELAPAGSTPPAAQALAMRLATLAPTDPSLPLYGLDGCSVVLHVLHGWGGGAQRFVEDLARADRERHHLVLLARSDSALRQHGTALALHADLHSPALRQWPLSAPIAATALHSDEYAAHLATVVRDFGVGALLVSSLIGHSLDALRSGLPTAVVCHDYYPLWPRLHADFGDAKRDYSAAGIDAALAQPGPDFEFSDLRPQAWRALRAAYVQALQRADATLLAPSACVQDNLCRIEPALAQRAWRRIEHGFAPWPAPLPVIAPEPGRTTLRIVVPGRLRAGKGEALIAALLPHLPEDVELVLVGGGAAAMRFFGQRGVHVLLDFRREALPALLAMLKPDAALLASTVSETYSYLLSELWSLQLPVIATHLGSFAERIEHGRSGLLVEPDATALAALLARLRDDRSALDALRAATLPALPSLDQMAQAYRDALPTATAPFTPSIHLDTDARSARNEADLAEQRATLAQTLARLAAQQQELDRRADWALSQEKLAAERTRWAQAAQAEADTLKQRNSDLDSEVQARGQWAHSLLAEAERLKELVVSEQQRLEADAQREREQAAQARERIESQLAQVLSSSSWRLTRPLRWLRRSLGALPTRLGFQTRRVASVAHRLQRSMKTRGLGGTVNRIRQEFRPPQPGATFVLPAPDIDTLPVLTQVDAPRASVIVPVYNHFHHTRTCLQALAACGDAAPFEVIVVDDGSSDETAERLASLPGLRYHRNPKNLGFIGACNAGASLARGEFLIFLNNDTAVQPGWLDALLATFVQHQDVGLAGSKLVYPDGRLQEAGGIVFSDASGWNYGRFDDPADPRYNFVREVDYCSGAAIAIRKDLFDTFGGFDTHYAPAYYEDTDLAMKVRQAGLRVLYQPASVVVHFEGVTSGTDTAGSGTKRFQVINQQKFLERWREVLATHPAPGTDIAIARQHRARKRVLIIDATTPQPDHDSGSLRLVNAMKVMRAEGCALAFFADNRAWIERYTAELQQLGVEVLWHPWLSDPVRWFADNGRRFDLVFISRHYIASSYVGLVRLHAPQARLVFDTVDLHYLREQREAELSGSREQAQTAAITRGKELALIRSSDITLVVSPVEQELLAREAPGARVEVLSNVHEVFGRRRNFAERKDLMFMGGYQHPPNVDAALWFVHEVFPLVRRQLPEVRFHLLGSKANDTVRALGEVAGVEFHGFVADIEPFLDGCRLALAPLRYGAGVKGKVNMSMSYGQPVVATPIAVEGMYAEAGRDVLVAADAAAFADEIVRVYGDEALWTSLSDHGLENVRRHFSFDAARAAVRRLLE